MPPRGYRSRTESIPQWIAGVQVHPQLDLRHDHSLHPPDPTQLRRIHVPSSSLPSPVQKLIINQFLKFCISWVTYLVKWKNKNYFDIGTKFWCILHCSLSLSISSYSSWHFSSFIQTSLVTWFRRLLNKYILKKAVQDPFNLFLYYFSSFFAFCAKKKPFRDNNFLFYLTVFGRYFVPWIQIRILTSKALQSKEGSKDIYNFWCHIF